MVQAIFEAVFKITGTQPKTLDQVKGELKSFLHRNEAADLIVDDDLETLIELAAIYAGREDIVDQKLISVIQRSDPQLQQRAGEVLKPQTLLEHSQIIESIARQIERVHPDLHLAPSRKDGFGMMDARGIVFNMVQMRAIIGVEDAYSGRVEFPRIKTKDEMIHLIPERFKTDKTWIIRGQGSGARCEGRYFTIEELLELLMDRKIISYGSYL